MPHIPEDLIRAEERVLLERRSLDMIEEAFRIGELKLATMVRIRFCFAEVRLGKLYLTQHRGPIFEMPAGIQVSSFVFIGNRFGFPPQQSAALPESAQQR